MKSRENLDLLSALVRGHNAVRPRAGKASELLPDLAALLGAARDIGDEEIGSAAWVISGVQQLVSQSALPSRHWDRAFFDASDLYACLKAARVLASGAEIISPRNIERLIYTRYFDARCSQRFRRQYRSIFRRLFLRPVWLRQHRRIEALSVIFQADTATLLKHGTNLPHPKLRIGALAAIFHAIETA